MKTTTKAVTVLTCDRCNKKITGKQMVRVQHLKKYLSGNVIRTVYFWSVFDDMHFHRVFWKKEVVG